MNIYEVKTDKGIIHVSSWNESGAINLMSYEGYVIISIKQID